MLWKSSLSTKPADLMWMASNGFLMLFCVWNSDFRNRQINATRFYLYALLILYLYENIVTYTFLS